MIISTEYSGVSHNEMRVVHQFQGDAPVDVVAICGALGVNVWEDSLGNGVSGKLFRDPVNGGSSGYSIVANASEPFVRRRFTIAHELSHFLLHRHQSSDPISDDVYYRSGLSNAMEYQANQLAADILMPMELVSRLINSGMRDVESLASTLQVSVAAMKIRLGIPVVD